MLSALANVAMGRFFSDVMNASLVSLSEAFWIQWGHVLKPSLALSEGFLEGFQLEGKRQ